MTDWLGVYMLTCTYIHIYVCICVYVWICIYMYVYTSYNLWPFLSLYNYISTGRWAVGVGGGVPESAAEADGIWPCSEVDAASRCRGCWPVCVSVCMCVCVSVYVCVYECICMCVCTGVCMCMHVYGFNLDKQNCLCAQAAAFYFFTFRMMEVWYNLDLI